MPHSLRFPALPLQTLFSSGFLTVGHAPGHRYLEARWLRHVSGGELREGAAAIIGNACAYGIELLLVDTRRQGLLCAAEQRWLSDHLGAHPVPTMRRSAHLLSSDPLQHLVTEVITEKAGRLPYESAAFLCEKLAWRWLFREVPAGLRAQ